jgi:hypothetical protein
MSSVKFGTVVPLGVPGEGGYGHRSDVNLSAMFATPVGTTYSETAVRNAGISALNGGGGAGDSIPNIGVTEGVINDGGYMFGTFNLNFPNAPDLETVDTGGEGRPSSPYTPNPASPGPGSVQPADQPEFTGVIPEKGNEYGVGLGAVSPSVTADGIRGQTIGSYLIGRSYLGSDGRT